MAKRKKGGSFSTWLLILLGFVAGAGFVIIALNYMDFEKPKPAPVKPHVAQVPQPVPEQAPSQAPQPPVEAPVQPSAPEVTKPPVTHVRPGRLAIVIDDLGGDMKKLRELVEMNQPITVAVIPNLGHSKDVSREASSKGLDVLIHMPMEPKDSADNNPGTGALLVSMSPQEIRARMDEDFKTVPDAIGLNNHMGSRFTEDESRMKTVLQVVKDRNMFFLDSRTTSGSVGGKLAREMGLRNADRNVFLDNTRDVGAIKEQILEAARLAKKKGQAIAIGHPYPETFRALKEASPALENMGVKVVRLSEIVGQGLPQQGRK